MIEDTNVLATIRDYVHPRARVPMGSELLQKLVNKSMTKEELFQNVKEDFGMLPEVLNGISSSKAAVRYGCAKVLMDLSEEHPEKLYPYIDYFINLLDSKYRILTWNAMAIIANLAKVDKDKKFDAIFDKYYSFLNDDYLVTVVSVVRHSSKIALAKPYLIPKITNELLKVDNISITPHLTDECRRVIAEKAIKSFDLFFDRIDTKEKVISFAKRHLDSSRKTLKREAESFLRRWDQ
jgi:hypothetical protein